jgi:hypothetical protein
LQPLFSEIYKQGYWGTSSRQAFYSGYGSHDKSQTLPYINTVKTFFTTLPEKPVIVDLGCGDFNIGQQLCDSAKHYHAIDIVAELISYNQKRYSKDNLSFICMNAASDKLPKGDVLLIRQVLQHLDNHSISAILKQAERYPYVIVTEHIPNGEFTPNKDKPSGPDSRLRVKSGVDITAPPFSFTRYGNRMLFSVATTDFPGIVETRLFSRQL